MAPSRCCCCCCCVIITLQRLQRLGYLASSHREHRALARSLPCWLARLGGASLASTNARTTDTKQPRSRSRSHCVRCRIALASLSLACPPLRRLFRGRHAHPSAMALPIDNYGVEFHDYSYEAETLHLDEPAPMVRIAMIPRATTFRSPCSPVPRRTATSRARARVPASVGSIRAQVPEAARVMQQRHRHGAVQLQHCSQGARQAGRPDPRYIRAATTATAAATATSVH